MTTAEPCEEVILDHPPALREARRDCPDPVGAARALRELVDAHSDEAERLGYLPEPVVTAIAKSGLYGLLLPKDLGGAEPHPTQAFDAIAELSYADASTGWAVMANQFAIAGPAACGAPSLTQAIFDGADGFIVAGQISKLGHADRVPGGFQAQGEFQFGSGGREAAWFLGAFLEYTDGEPVMNANGKPSVKVLFAPRRNVRLRRNWDVMGLAATASYDFEFVPQFIPEDFQLTGKVVRGGPACHAPVSLGHAAWAIGAARRALDEMKSLAQRKRRFGRAGLIDQQTFQFDFAQAEAMLRASADNCRAAFTRLYDAVAAGAVDIEVKADYRLAACWAVDTAVKVGHFVYLASGSDGLRNHGGANRLQRAFRDIHAGSQHRHTDHNIEIDCATVLLGVADPPPEL